MRRALFNLMLATASDSLECECGQQRWCWDCCGRAVVLVTLVPIALAILEGA